MPALRELQEAFAAAIVSGDMGEIAAWIAEGPITPSERLRIHRNTMLGALAGALRLAYPAADALVGADFFDQAAGAFARRSPPRAPLLTLYGAEFPEFLASYAPAASLPYLADVARLEWAVEVAARGPASDDAPPLAKADLGELSLALAPSLTLLRTAYPAEPIWRAVLDGDEAAIAAIDPGPAAATLAIWRQGDGAAVAALGPVSAAFLGALITGADAESALAAAAALAEGDDPIAAIATEILPAGFVHLTPIS